VLLLDGVDFGLELVLVLDGHLGGIDGRLVQLVELGRVVVHDAAHLHLVREALQAAAFLLEHQVLGQVHVLVVLYGPDLAEGRGEVARRVHLLHDERHG